MKYPLALVAFAIASVAVDVHADNSLRDPATRIVRGYNGAAPCNPTVIGQGSLPKAGVKEDMSNPSVSCSDDKHDDWKALRKPLPNPHACVTTLGDLRKWRREVTLVRDPTDTNPHHCVLSTITPKQFVSGSRYRP